MMMPGREYQAQPSRFGFNGKENDNDVKGFGNQQDYGMRIYDARLAKFLSVDPISQHFPELSTYQFASDSPIANIDLDGLEAHPIEKDNPSNSLRIVPKEPGKVVELNPNKQSYWDKGIKWLRNKLKPLTDKLANFKKPTPTLPLRPGTPIIIPQEDPNGGQVPIPIRKPVSENPKPGDEKVLVRDPHGQPVPAVKQDPNEDGDEDDPNDGIVYRGGTRTDLNFTPRPKDASTGLSANVDPLSATMGQGGKVQGMSVKMLRNLGFIVKFDGGGHVSIRPRTKQEMEQWISTRNKLDPGKTGQENAHDLTRLAQSTIIFSFEVKK